jgi:hypothetical protein
MGRMAMSTKDAARAFLRDALGGAVNEREIITGALSGKGFVRRAAGGRRSVDVAMSGQASSTVPSLRGEAAGPPQIKLRRYFLTPSNTVGKEKVSSAAYGVDMDRKSFETLVSKTAAETGKEGVMPSRQPSPPPSTMQAVASSISIPAKKSGSTSKLRTAPSRAYPAAAISIGSMTLASRKLPIETRLSETAILALSGSKNAPVSSSSRKPHASVPRPNHLAKAIRRSATDTTIVLRCNQSASATA